MDRNSRIAVFACAILLVGLELALEKYYPTPVKKPAPVVATATPNAASPTVTTPGHETTVSAPVKPVLEEKITTLENDAIKMKLTSRGAAVKTVELKAHQNDKTNNVVLNQNAHSNVMELRGWPGADVQSFEIVSSTPDQVVYQAQLANGVKWERSYAFAEIKDTEAGMSGYLRDLFHKIAVTLGQKQEKPLVYNVAVRDTLTNTIKEEVNLPSYALGLGRAEPLLVKGNYHSTSDIYLGSGWFTKSFHFTTVAEFNASTWFGVYKSREMRPLFYSTEIDPLPLRWIGVENQFYTVLLTPAEDHLITKGEFECFNPRHDGYGEADHDSYGYLKPSSIPDIEAAAHFPEVKLTPGQVVSFNYVLYAGPKEFNRLDALGENQGEIMNYGMFAILIVPMLTILHFWYLIFHNYGVAIILLTCIIKAITWPLQSIANRSGKRMQALAPKLKEIQAKYKDQPEKLQSETFSMYRDYGVNPFGGCLPALVQMPVFFSLYFMLMNAVELRGQSFIWVNDLTQPDTIATLTLPFSLPFIGSILMLNPLPIVVTLLTMVMMRMTPQIGDPAQAKIAQWMPLIFLFIFYNFAAALSLYYVINNCVSIIQIYRNLKKPMPELVRIPRKK